ncbi:MAG: cytochrome C, partial [bacterium]|nr:cytochrome C [bacterium]
NNTISFIGVFLVTTAGVAWLFVLPVEASEGASHPYLGILFYVILPGTFFLGLVLTPLGISLRLRKERKRHILPDVFPPLNWRNRDFRKLVKFVSVATVMNIIIGGYYTHATVTYMASSNFCGVTCHSMTPEFTAYTGSPHVNVACIDCHVGAGAEAYVESKMRGVAQLIATTLDNFERPIPTPVHTLRPARDTCEQCHWPQKFGGYRIRVWDKFDEDEQNTAAKTVLVMRIGGGSMTAGIHGFHTAPGVVIEYASDPARQHIPWVRYTDPDGNTTEYTTEEWTPGIAPNYEKRLMDCLDCHTRPSHQFMVPDRALDQALAIGQVDPSLPWANKKGLEILQAKYSSTAEAEQAIPAALVGVYQTEHPEVWSTRQRVVESLA